MPRRRHDNPSGAPPPRHHTPSCCCSSCLACRRLPAAHRAGGGLTPELVSRNTPSGRQAPRGWCSPGLGTTPTHGSSCCRSNTCSHTCADPNDLRCLAPAPDPAARSSSSDPASVAPNLWLPALGDHPLRRAPPAVEATAPA
jgi:hypothetical protein